MSLMTDPSTSNKFVKFLDDETANKLMNICQPEEFESQLAMFLGKMHTHLNLEDAVLVDFYVAGLWWALKKKFNLEQFQAFSSLLHQQIINISEKHLSLVEHLEELKVSLERMEEFKEEKEVKEAVDYFMVSIYQPFKMYEFLFNEERCPLQLDGNFMIQTPHASIEPLPLNEGLSKENYGVIFLDKNKKTCEKEEVKEVKAEEEKLLDETTEVKMMSGIPKKKILEAVEEIFNELAPGIQEELVCKLEEKKNLFLNKLNVTNTLRNFKL